MSSTPPQGYVRQTLESRYIKVKILEAFLLANAETFGEASTYDATSTEGLIEVTVKRALTKTEVFSLQKESYPKRFKDDSESD